MRMRKDEPNNEFNFIIIQLILLLAAATASWLLRARPFWLGSGGLVKGPRTMKKAHENKLTVWKPEECEFSIYSIRVRSKMRSKGSVYTKVLDGDPSDFPDMKFQPDGKLQAPKDADAKTKAQAKLNSVCTAIYDLIINSIGIGPTKHIVSAGVREGDGPRAWAALKEQCGGVNKSVAYPTQKKLRDLRLSHCDSISDYTFEFKNNCATVVAALKADPNEPIKGLPDCFLKGMYIDGLENVLPTITKIAESSSDMSFSKTCELCKDAVMRGGNNVDIAGNEQPGNANAASRFKSTRGCFNCGSSNHSERSCTRPCKMCNDANHTRHGCPKRNENESQPSKPPSSRGGGGSANSATSGSDDSRVAELESLVSSLKSQVSILSGAPNAPSSPGGPSAPPQTGRAFHAIAKGRGGHRGVVSSWRDCSALTQGAPGATFKKFDNVDTAESFAHGGHGAGHAVSLVHTRHEHAPRALQVEAKTSAEASAPKIDSGADKSHWGSAFSHELTNISPASGSVKVANGQIQKVVGVGSHCGTPDIHIVEGFPERLLSVASTTRHNQAQVFFDAHG